jgi:AraC-like DNA-binding protein
MREAGIELAPLLAKAGLTSRQIEDSKARISVESQIRFLVLAANALNDKFLGFHLAVDYDLREIGLLYYVLASSEVLGDALRRAERYSAIVNEGVAVRFRDGRHTTITCNYVGVERTSDRHQIEFWLTSVIRICRQLTSHHLVPIRVKIIHHRKGIPRELAAFLGCNIDFGANVDEVLFPGNIKHLPVVSADPYLNKLLINYCEEALAHREANRGTLRSTLEHAIALLLPHGQAQAGAVARRLGMSQRTLARRLSSEGLTFAGILTELRADLAERYLQDEDLTISQISWLLGYREVSAFTRAFKHWTGKTPSEARYQAGL